MRGLSVLASTSFGFSNNLSYIAAVSVPSMEKFTSFVGLVAPLLEPNIDTDQIIPGPEIMRRAARAENVDWGRGLFAHWRYLADGTPNRNFILNQSPWSRAEILLTGPNFGCGSSRECAALALRSFGIRCIIAPSFAEIFRANCFRNGILPISLDANQVQTLRAEIRTEAPLELRIDLDREVIVGRGGLELNFQTPCLLRRMLLEGADEIDLILRHTQAIAAFRERDRLKRAWAYLG